MNPLRRLISRISGSADRFVERESAAAEATATCAAGCGEPVHLVEAHYTILRQAEREIPGEISPFDGDPLGYVHIGCWPRDVVPVVIAAKVGAPDETRLTADGGRS